jgi:hypothetical protein
MQKPFEDDFIPAPRLSAALRDLTGDPGPGHQALLALANDAKIAPPMERSGLNNRFWGCRKSRLTELAKLLGFPALHRRHAPLGGGRQQPKASAHAPANISQ